MTFKKINQNCDTTPPHEDDSLINPFIESPKAGDRKGRLPNYKVGMEIDPELLIQETNEVTAPYSECSLTISLGKFGD
nr:6310_t:CDS:2 [Entrophospora candida]